MDQKKVLLLVAIAGAIYYFCVHYKKTSVGQLVPTVLKDAAAAAGNVINPDAGKVRVSTQEDLLPKSIGMVPVNLIQSDPKALLGISDASA